MAISLEKWIVQPLVDGAPGVLVGTGAPGTEVYPAGTIYTRRDAARTYVTSGAGTWEAILDAGSSIANHLAAATTAAGTGATGSDGTGATGASGTDATGSSGTGAVTGTSASTSIAAIATEDFTAPAAAGVAVHAQIDDATASPVTTAITNPVIPRNIVSTYGAAWGGGNPTFAGTDQDDAAVSEVHTVNLGGSFSGVVIFKTITSISYTPAGGGAGHTLDVATGEKLGILAPYSGTACIAACNGVLDLATFSATLHERGFTPVLAANGARNYSVTVPSTATGHTHGAGSFAGPAHTHTGPSHTHTGPAHTHTGPSHTHDSPVLSHSITP